MRRATQHRYADGDLHAAADTTPPVVTITGPTSAATYATSATPLTLERDGVGQRRGDAGQLGEQPGRVGDGDRHDELVGERDRAAERVRTC